MFPITAQGHIVPMVDIDRILSQRGATVTIITTPLVAERFRPVILRAIQAKLKIQLLELKLPLAEVGLPEGSENYDTIRHSEVLDKLMFATDLIEEPAEDMLRGLCPPPDCIISDFFLPWTSDVARRFNIPWLMFNGLGCFCLVSMHVVFTSKILEGIESDTERFVVPGFPDRFKVTKLQIIGSSKEDFTDKKGFMFRAIEAENAVHGIIVHTFEELEPEYVKELSNSKAKKVWCIGPVTLSNKDNLDIAERGNNKAAIDKHDCLKWLDEREPGSVLFVCLGSLARVSTQQAIELGLGLKSTNKQFIWCVRNKSKELQKWFVEEGYEERVKDRGLIVHGWAPQVLILSHQAIGGFLTHCGWNSLLETISAGIPVVTWPFFADQFLNETFMVEILKIGVRIGVEIPVPFGDEDKHGVLVQKEDIKTTVECLMDKEDEEGKQRRKRAGELAEMVKTVMAEGGSSYINVSSLIQDIETFRAQHKSVSLLSL
ncbi:UDP-glycosyltransferase 73E1-like protein [Tanacetum coccineum]